MQGKISVIAPMFNERENVSRLADEITAAMKNLDHPYEVILVNDGSSDETWKEIVAICQRDKHFIGVDLAGNYGQTVALRSGLEKSGGDIIVFMDGDLQHDPADIPRLVEKLEEGYDMVGGAKSKRPDGFIKKHLSQFAHWLIRMISGAKMSYFGGTFRAYRRYLLEDTNLLGDAHRFLGAILARKGVRYTEIPIEIRERKSGKSHYSLKKIYFVVIDLIFLKFTVTYMNKPFRLFGLSGAFIFLIGLLPTMYILIGSIFFGFNIRLNYLAEFLFSIFVIITGLLLISFGLIAEIGVYNYFSKGNHSPYTIRKVTENTPTDE